MKVRINLGRPFRDLERGFRKGVVNPVKKIAAPVLASGAFGPVGQVAGAVLGMSGGGGGGGRTPGAPGGGVASSLAPPANPNAGTLTNHANLRADLGASNLGGYMGLLGDAAKQRAATLRAGYGQDALGRMALTRAQTGADRAYAAGRSNLSLDLNRRGLGGGVLAGGLANLEGQRAGTMANAYQQVARDRINAQNAGERELLGMYGNLVGLSNGIGMQGDAQLATLGNAEAARQAEGQKLAAELAGYLSMVYGQQGGGSMGGGMGWPATPTTFPTGGGAGNVPGILAMLQALGVRF